MPRREKENINYTIFDPIEHDNNETKESGEEIAADILKEFEDMESPESSNNEIEYFNELRDNIYCQMNEYEMDYSSKQLVAIYEYYKLGPSNRLKKGELAELIVNFENDEKNADLVERRQTLWFYMKELKEDPFTKKYVWAP